MFWSWEIHTHTHNTYISGCLNRYFRIAAEGDSETLQGMEGKPYVPSHVDEMILPVDLQNTHNLIISFVFSVENIMASVS